MPIKKKHKHVTDENRTRPVAVKFYLTDEEAARFDQALAKTGLTRRELVMSAIDGLTVIDADARKEIQDVFSAVKDVQVQIRGIGVNMNQMAKVANSHGDLPLEQTLVNLANETMQIGKEVNKSCQSLNRLTHAPTVKQP